MGPAAAFGGPRLRHERDEAAVNVSVIVITRNRPQFLPRALASLAAQTYHDFETVVVNDAGSYVGAIVRASGLPANVVVRDECGGCPGARNSGLRAARGDWITYLDDDDIAYPHHLATLVEAQQRTGAKVVYSDSVLVIEEERDGQWVTLSSRPFYGYEFDRGRLMVDNITPANNVMHTRESIERVGLFDEGLKFLDDWDMMIRLAHYWDFAHVPRVTAEYRQRTTREGVTVDTANLHGHYYAYVQAKLAVMRTLPGNPWPALP